MFVPVKICPWRVNTAAPTLKWEYGEYEFSRAFCAASNNAAWISFVVGLLILLFYNKGAKSQAVL